MSFDFKLNKKGDLLFEYSSRDSSSLQFDFFVSNTNGLIFDFYVDSPNSQKYLSDLTPGLMFKFFIDSPEHNKEICIIEDDEYIEQQIKIRLTSALGSIRGNETVGSRLDDYRHILLNPDKENSYADIIYCVEQALKDILPNATVEVYNKPGIYTDFTNSLIISIYQDEFQYYYYL